MERISVVGDVVVQAVAEQQDRRRRHGARSTWTSGSTSPPLAAERATSEWLRGSFAARSGAMRRIDSGAGPGSIVGQPSRSPSRHQVGPRITDVEDDRSSPAASVGQRRSACHAGTGRARAPAISRSMRPGDPAHAPDQVLRPGLEARFAARAVETEEQAEVSARRSATRPRAAPRDRRHHEHPRRLLEARGTLPGSRPVRTTSMAVRSAGPCDGPRRRRARRPVASPRRPRARRARTRR